MAAQKTSVQNERGEWPADNFLIRGTAFNKACCSSTCSTTGRPHRRPHAGPQVAIDARAPLYDGGICTRIDCVSLGVVVNRDGERFHDEGEGLLAQTLRHLGAAWWRSKSGRLAIGHRQLRPLAASMPPVFPGVRTPEGIARAGAKAGLPAAFTRTSMPTTPPAAPAVRPHRAGRLPHRRRHARQNALGPAHRHRGRSMATRSSRASPSPGPAHRRHGRRALQQRAQPQPVCGL